MFPRRACNSVYRLRSHGPVFLTIAALLLMGSAAGRANPVASVTLASAPVSASVPQPALASASPTMSAPFDISAVIRQVHFAFRPEGADFKGGDTNYSARVSPDGAIEFMPVAYPDAQTFERPADPNDPRSRHNRREVQHEIEYGEALEGEPITFKTISIARGVFELADVLPQIDGTDDGGLILERGDAFEHLKNEAAGVHQSWYFDRKPAGGGDLVLRIQVDGDFEYGGETDGGLHFTDPDSGLGARYGHATWIDAKGEKTEVRAEWQDGEIALLVTEETLESSAYPATLDPLIGPSFEVSSSSLEAPSVAFDGANYLVIWSDNSLTESDIFGVRVSPTGTLLDPQGICLTSSALQHVRAPQVAFGSTTWLVVWRDRRDSGYHIYAQRVNPDGTLAGSNFAISTIGNWLNTPDVSYGSETWLVTWTEDNTPFVSTGAVLGQMVASDGSLVGDKITLSSSAGYQFHPQVAFDGTQYLVVWADVDVVGIHASIYGRRVNSSGNPIGSEFLINGAAGNGLGNNLGVAAGETCFFVVWTHKDNYLVGSRITSTGEVLDADGIIVNPEFGLDPQVISDRDSFLVLWFSSNLYLKGNWVSESGIAMSSTGFPVVDEEVDPRNGSASGPPSGIVSEGNGRLFLSYKTYTTPAYIRGRIIHDGFLSESAVRQSDGSVLITWQANPQVAQAAGVNIYGSLSFEENFDKLNVAPLALSGTFVDVDPYEGIPNYYWLELVFADGSSSRDRRDVVWLTPEAVPTDFLLSVRETTVASVPGNVSVFDVQVMSQKGFTGTVTLGIAGLGAEAESWSFDDPVVEVPGRATLTITWDPLLAPPAGGTAYPFQVTANDGGAVATINHINLLGVVIDPSDNYLTQFVYPAEPTAGHEAEVFGRLTPNQADQTVWVDVSQGTDALYEATTDVESRFSVTVPVNAAGQVTFRSTYGSTQSAEYPADALRGRRHIRMTGTKADGEIIPGDLVEIDGEIDPNPGVGNIFMKTEYPDGSIAFEGNMSLDSHGAFHQSFYAQPGVTKVEVEYAGDEDFYNSQARLNVPVNAPIGMAIVVAGGGDQPENTLWGATEELCDRVYDVYRGRLIPENRIYYLHPAPDQHPDPHVDATPTRANLQAAIENWASAKVDVATTYAPFKTPLTIYIMGLEEISGVLRLTDDPSVEPDQQIVTVAQLGDMLDNFLANVIARYPDPCIPELANCPPESVPVNVVLEFEESGAFVDELAGQGRIIVTSTGDGGGEFPGYNLVSLDGDIAFSRYFYDDIDQGKYIATGWATGTEWMLAYSGYSQWPLIESNGNGIANEVIDQTSGDGAGDKMLEYRDTYERRPAIDTMFSGLTVPEGTSAGLLWAKILDFGETIDRVKCVILPPSGSGEPVREYAMRWNQGMSRWELNHDGFRHKGLYKILITAVDEDEDAALPWVSVVDVRGDTEGDDVTPPEDVTDVYTLAQDGQVYLSWTESVSSDVAGYKVYTKPAGGAYGTGVYAGNGDHFTVTGLTNGASYRFKITAIDEVPNESAGVETGVITPRGADFAADATKVLPNTTVHFTDLSTGSPIGWSWDLDGDTVSDSAAQHPSYLYTTLGTYTVTLTATYADGSDQEAKADYISVQGQVADFSAVPTHGTLPMSVQFTDESVGESAITAWSWDFDGDAVEDSAEQHPSHQYDAPGEYDVTLTVTSSGGTDAETKAGYIVVSCPTPDPTFTSDVTSGPAPLDVAFTSTTTAPATGCDPTAWSWTFGDSASGAGEIVAHTYTEDGLYDVCLTVTVPGTSAQTCVVDYIDVGGGCASGNLCLTLLLAGYWDGTEQSTEAYLTVDFYADLGTAPSYRITNVQLDVDGTAIVDLTAAGVLPGAYYVVARPLNHLDVMSETALTVGGLAAAGLDADFTDPTQVACGEAALVFVGERWCAPGGDASGDGLVDLSDYSLLAQQWGLTGPEADFTGDAVVDLSDYSNLAQYWTRQMCEDVPEAE